MLRQRAETLRRPWCGLAVGACLALVPKCLLCVLAYAGLGAALGLGGPELCGAAGDAAGHGTTWLFALGVVVGAAGLLARPARPAPALQDNRLFGEPAQVGMIEQQFHRGLEAGGIVRVETGQERTVEIKDAPQPSVPDQRHHDFRA